MAQDYQVNYDINVFAEDAVQAIGRFTMAAEQLKKASAPFQKLNQKINALKQNITSLGRVKSEVNINTKSAEAKIDRLQAKLDKLKATARSLNLAVGAGGGGGVGSATSRGRAATRGGSTVVSGGSTRRVSRTPSASNDPVIANWQRMQQKYAQQAKLIKENAAMFGRNYKNDPLYSRYMRASNAAGRRVFAMQNPGVMSAWDQAYANYVPPAPPVRGRGRTAGRGARTGAARMGGRRSIYPNALGYKTLGATPLDVGGIGAVDMLKGMGIAYGVMGVGTAIGGAISDATEYDNIIQTTRNILGSHDNRENFEGRFRGMEHNIRNIGVKTKFTAPEVADASRFLAMAGLNIEEINSAIRPIADIALIADTDIGETADVVTNIMTAYGMGANQMRDIADKMTMTFTMSNTTLPEMAESYKYFASIARANNWSFDETTGMIGILGDAGLKGSHAGTTIRQLMNNLIKPTKSQKAALDRFGVTTKNADGTLRSPYAIFKDLAEAGAQSSTFDLFRVTAAQGGVSLMQSVEKWDKIIEENRNSAGISSQLAEAKQNTVQGLWAQVTSMFTEGSMQAFEAVRPEVASMLKNVTEWLSTDETRNRIKAFAQDIVSFAKVLGDITLTFIGFYEKFREPIKWLLEMQMRMWPLIWAARVFKSAWYGVLGVMKGAGAFLRMVNVLGLFATNVRRGTTAMQGFRNAQAGMMSFGNNGIGGFGAFSYYNALAQRGRAIDPEVWNRYVQMQSKKPGGLMPLMKGGFRSMLRTGAGSLGGGLAGYAIGNAINEDYGGMIGAVAGTAAGGALASTGALTALFTNPVGWGVLAAGALAGVVAYIIDVNNSITEGVRLSQEWGKEFRNLGVNGLDMNDPNSMVIGGLRIMNNELLSQTEKLSQAIDLWNRYHRAKNGDDTENLKNDSTPLIETPGGKDYNKWLERADQFSGVYTPFTDLTNQIGQHIPVRIYDDALGQMTEINGHSFRSYYLNPQGISYMPEQAAVQIAAAQWAANPNNERYKAAEMFLMNQLTSVSRAQDIPGILAQARRDYLITPNQNLGWISSERAQELSAWETMTIPAAAAAFNYMIEQLIANRFAKWEEVLQQYDLTGTVEEEEIQAAVQSRMGELYGLVFDPANGLFGSDQWWNYWASIINDPSLLKDENGNPLFASSDAVKSYITDVHQAFMQMYGQLSDRYKVLFAGLINEEYWNALLNFQPPVSGGGTSSVPLVMQQPTNSSNSSFSWMPVWGNNSNTTTSWWNGGGLFGGRKQNNTQNTPSLTRPVVTPTVNKPTLTRPTLPKVTPPKVPNPHGGGSGGHTGANQSNYKSHYNNNTAAPKQVIVKIENLMNVKSIDLTNADNVAVVENVKQQLTQALIDVVHDFDETYHG